MCEYNPILTAFDQAQRSKNISAVKMRTLLKQADNCNQCSEHIDDDSHNEYDCRCLQNKRINLRNLFYYISIEY